MLLLLLLLLLPYCTHLHGVDGCLWNGPCSRTGHQPLYHCQLCSVSLHPWLDLNTTTTNNQMTHMLKGSNKNRNQKQQLLFSYLLQFLKICTIFKWLLTNLCTNLNNNNKKKNINTNYNNNNFQSTIRDILQSPHRAVNRLQLVRWSGLHGIVCKSHATHQALFQAACRVMCHMVRRDSSVIKFDELKLHLIELYLIGWTIKPMKEVRKPEYQEKTSGDELQKMPHTKGRKFKPKARFEPAQ